MAELPNLTDYDDLKRFMKKTPYVPNYKKAYQPIQEYELETPDINIDWIRQFMYNDPIKEKIYSNNLSNNPDIKRLSNSMIKFIYPRIQQLMSDFAMNEISQAHFNIRNESFDNIYFKTENNHIFLKFSRSIQSSSSIYGSYLSFKITGENVCPALKDLNSIQSKTNQKDTVKKYTNYCNAVMDILTCLEKYESELRKTVLRAENYCLRFERVVIFEKKLNF